MNSAIDFVHLVDIVFTIDSLVLTIGSSIGTLRPLDETFPAISNYQVMW